MIPFEREEVRSIACLHLADRSLMFSHYRLMRSPICTHPPVLFVNLLPLLDRKLQLHCNKNGNTGGEKVQRHVRRGDHIEKIRYFYNVDRVFPARWKRSLTPSLYLRR